jgi:hypothetical protein
MITAQQPFRSTELIRASLILSGVSDRELDSYTSKFQDYLAEVRSHLQPYSNNPYELGKALLVYLHETRLKRYDSSETSLQTLYKKGKFNCLSSTLLYLICARHLGLVVEPIGTSDHVLCRMKYGENWIAVETTTKFGFHPGTRNEFLDDTGRVKGSTYVPPKNYRGLKPISELELLSLLLREQLLDKDPEALRVAIDWYLLVPTEDAQRNLAFASSHYVSWLNSKELFDLAMTFVRRYKKRFESDDVLRKSVQALLHRQILFFTEMKKFDLAEQLLDESRTVLAIDLTQVLAENLLAKAMREAKRKRQYEPALNLTARLTANGHLPEARSADYADYLNFHKNQAARRK